MHGVIMSINRANNFILYWHNNCGPLVNCNEEYGQQSFVEWNYKILNNAMKQIKFYLMSDFSLNWSKFYGMWIDGDKVSRPTWKLLWIYEIHIRALFKKKSIIWSYILTKQRERNFCVYSLVLNMNFVYIACLKHVKYVYSMG